MIYFEGAPGDCNNPECCHNEVNSVRQCDACGKFTMIIRDPRTLSDGDVYAYDPVCGRTYHVRTQLQA